MVAVTLLAYFLSLRQDEAPLSVIDALGGLGTPFLLYTEAGTLGGLVIYTCLVLAGMAGVYFYKGWVSLLAVSSAGGWMVFLIGYLSSFSLGGAVLRRSLGSAARRDLRVVTLLARHGSAGALAWIRARYSASVHRLYSYHLARL